jgi:hypothetical protein
VYTLRHLTADVGVLEPRFDRVDPHSDEGLRHALRTVGRSGSWDQPAGRRLLAPTWLKLVRT